MIIDNIKNAGLYYGMNENIEKALKYLQETDFSKMEPGKYEIEGSNVFALVQHYSTKPQYEGKWEAHRKYIDIQYLADGTEQMGYAYVGSLEVIKDYDVEGDYLLLRGSGNMLACTTGTFAIFGPEDAHMPGIDADAQNQVKKVVIKVIAQKNKNL